MSAVLTNFLLSDFPLLAQGVGLGILTILIPVAIGVFDGKTEFQELDKHVLLDHVIKAKRILIYAALVFIPVIFWHASNLYIRYVEFALWIIGTALLVRIMVDAYKWLKGNKTPLRLGYLKLSANAQDTEEAWKSVWESKGLNSGIENDYFEIFSKKVNRLMGRYD